MPGNTQQPPPYLARDPARRVGDTTPPQSPPRGRGSLGFDSPRSPPTPAVMTRGAERAAGCPCLWAAGGAGPGDLGARRWRGPAGRCTPLGAYAWGSGGGIGGPAPAWRHRKATASAAASCGVFWGGAADGATVGVHTRRDWSCPRCLPRRVLPCMHCAVRRALRGSACTSNRSCCPGA